MRKNLVLAVGLGFVFFVVALAGAAETAYPTRSVELVVGASSGGGTDLLARVIAEKAKQFTGQEFVVTNKVGGAGPVLGAFQQARFKADGYSLGAISDGFIVLIPHLQKVSYDPFDCTFIAEYGTLDFGVYVLPDSPFKTFKDLVEWARANPGKLTIAITEVNSTNHIALQVLFQREKIQVSYIPFMGANPASMALLGGHVMAASTATSGFARHVKSKTVRLLCMMSETRMQDFPEVPTLKELGYHDIVYRGYYLMVGPKKLEESVAKRLEDVYRRAIESPEFAKTAKEMATYSEKHRYMGELTKFLADISKNYLRDLKALGLMTDKPTK
jgi:tripartite-type tricarboxylate transporter receptor subunit TctC